MRKIFKDINSNFSISVDCENYTNMEVEALIYDKLNGMRISELPSCILDIDIWNKCSIKFDGEQIMIFGDDGLVILEADSNNVTITI